MTAAPVGASSAGQASVLAMYRALVGIGILCGLLIVTVFEVTKPIIEQNRAEALRRAVFNVLPAASESQAFLRSGSEGFERVGEGEPSGPVVYAGYDEEGELVGVAVEAQGMGYQDVIKVLYGYSFDKDAIVGIQVLESKETPGLGDKIEKEDFFLANFEALDVSLADDGRTIANPIKAVKQGEKVNPWEVDGITGATISSVAIADMLRQSTAEWIPDLEGHQSIFEKQGATDD